MAVAGACAFPLAGHARDLYVEVAPPPPPHEEVLVPRHGYVVVPGYYRWDAPHHRHVWVRGHYVHERRGERYVAPRWHEDGDRYRFEDGHWERG